MESVRAPALAVLDMQLLNETLIVLLAAIVVVPVAQRLGMSAVLGYFFAGLAVGPRALGLVHDTATAATLAEFGVVFLLFAIGLELPLGRVAALRRYMFGMGLAQVAVTGLMMAAVALAGGMKLTAAAVAGLALALSSTATVLQLLGERGELTTRFGRVSVSVLLFQDLAAVPLLAALPLLAGADEALPMALALAPAQAERADRRVDPVEDLELAHVAARWRRARRPIKSSTAPKNSTMATAQPTTTGRPRPFANAAGFLIFGSPWTRNTTPSATRSKNSAKSPYCARKGSGVIREGGRTIFYSTTVSRIVQLIGGTFYGTIRR